jgi:hypothetical protein
MVKEGRGNNIINMAFREPEIEPVIVVPGNDPNSEEQFRNLIEDYKHLP